MKEARISPSSDGSHGRSGEGQECYEEFSFSVIIWLGVVVKSIWLYLATPPVEFTMICI